MTHYIPLLCSNKGFAVLDIHHCGSVWFWFPAMKSGWDFVSCCSCDTGVGTDFIYMYIYGRLTLNMGS
jgi:hypothetical protein